MSPVGPALSKPLRWFAGLTAAVCCCSLALQLVLFVDTAAVIGIAWPLTMMAFASFLTIQINLLAAIVTSLAAAGVNRWPGRGRIRSAIVAYLIAAGLIFPVLLRPAFHHTGSQALADALLHYLTPILYGLFWLTAVPKDDLLWRDAAIWMIYPLTYLAVLMPLDLWSGVSHYPPFNMQSLNGATLVMNIVTMSAVFLTAGLLVVALGREVVRLNSIAGTTRPRAFSGEVGTGSP